MAITVKLDFLLLERRLTLTELADRIGITIANLSILKTNKARAIRFSTLDAICRELQCQPGDVLVWTSEEGSPASAEPGECAGRRGLSSAGRADQATRKVRPARAAQPG